MDFEGVERRLAAILSADVVGYSHLMAEDEVATVRTLTVYREEIGLLVRQHRGRVVDSPGDNLLAEFPSATEAVRCAVGVQRALHARNTDLPVDFSSASRLSHGRRRLPFAVVRHILHLSDCQRSAAPGWRYSTAEARLDRSSHRCRNLR